MHEVSLCQNILNRVLTEKAAREQNNLPFSKVNKIKVELGRLSCVEASALNFAFDAVMKGSVAEHAQLEITHIEAKAICNACKEVITITKLTDACPICGAYAPKVIAGQDVFFKSMEVS